MNQKTLFIAAIAGVGLVVAYYIYKGLNLKMATGPPSNGSVNTTSQSTTVSTPTGTQTTSTSSNGNTTVTNTNTSTGQSTTTTGNSTTTSTTGSVSYLGTGMASTLRSAKGYYLTAPTNTNTPFTLTSSLLNNSTQQFMWNISPGTTTNVSAIIPQSSPTSCMDDSGNSMSAGTNIIMYGCNGQTNQQWSINSNNQIVNTKSGLCLDVNSTTLTTIQSPCGTATSWTAIPV